jgi:colanic acid/amylovoran biosynthesis glycosyltransferase
MEGIPVVIMEAVGVGLPVVSTLHSGIPELIKHGETGLLSKERDIGGISNNLLTIINNYNEANRMSETGYKHLLQNFETEKQNKKLVEIVNNLK